jgi:predicted small integral membrane protein
MNEFQTLIDQMVEDIASQAFQLRASYLLLFLEWLSHHNSRVRGIGQIPFNDCDQEQFKSSLIVWFQSLPLKGLLWEYHIMLDEIAWWRTLDPVSFAMQSKGH